MPTAYELLTTEACDDILTVDLESRTIKIPKNVSSLGVESDDETRILHFHLPRYYCNIDLSEFSIRINYKNVKGEGDLYMVTDTVVEDDLIKFDWVVGRHAFAKKGNVVFNICLKDVFEGIVRREFNTSIAILPVLEGLETSTELVEGHLDIFEQLREELVSNADEIVSEYLKENADDIVGPPGPKGDSFEYEDFTDAQLAALKGPQGDPGASIRSITRTSGNGAPGTTDTYTITLTNGTATTFKVYNGANGEGAGDMTAQVYDPQGKAQDIFKYVDDSVGNSFLGENITGDFSNDTPAFWADKKNGQAWFSSHGMLVNQPSKYGFLINYVNDTDVFQIFRNQNEGITYFRSGDNVNAWFQHWTMVYDSVNLTPDTIGAISKCKFWDSGDVTDLMGKGSCRYSFTSDVTGMPLPDNGYWWFVDTIGDNTEDITVIATTISDDPKVFIKSALNGTWGAWKQIVTENEYGNAFVSEYFTAKWLQTTADTYRSSAAEKIAVLDGSGWIYHRTPEEIRSDIGAMANRIKITSGDIKDLRGQPSNRYSIENTVTGMPKDGYWWFVDTFASSSDITIIAHKIGTTPETYIMSSLNSTWGDWCRVPLANSEGDLIVDGNVNCTYVIGKWVQTTDDNHLDEAATKIAVIDDKGWFYYRTPEETLRDIGGRPSHSTLVTLSSSKWIEQSNGRYTQSAEVSFMTEDAPVVSVDVHMSGSDPDADDIMEAAYLGNVYRMTQGIGTVTFWARSVPDVNIQVSVGVS